MTDAGTYTVRCIRTGRWWALDVDGVKGAFTQAANLDQIPLMAAGTVEGLTGSLPSQLRLVGPEVTAAFAERPAAPRGEAYRAALLEDLQAGSPADKQLLEEEVARLGYWSCVAVDGVVTCIRQPE
jgi:hypothetical protein